MRYADARSAIEFLRTAFGFEAAMVVEGEGGLIDHAQLVHETGMVMLGSARDDEFGRLVGGSASPFKASVYVVVDDVASHAERARGAGAEIIMEPADEDYGGSNYTARDPEGNIWSFGSYDPWAG
ncbi:MAG: VOC family protein [Acidimicrobiia bacterium]|nr:VOC family protein [Acidimicrobiia bacterium]MBT8246790.1 VOC family protein [Acidimicrobiia bacterium]NNF88866.1 bleomycin resistance protein [Acidimicrobiia bacterium]